MLTAEEARRLFSYDPETGVLRWRIKPGKKIKVGDVAGCKDACGYLIVGIKRKLYKVHRIIMLMENGDWPSSQVDHQNHIRSDNRICNLSCATHRENAKNKKRPSDNTSGHIGVSWRKDTNKWTVRIKVNHEYKCLGSYTDILDAIAIRKAAEIEFGFHSNHGR